MKNIFEELKRVAGELTSSSLIKNTLSSIGSEGLSKVRPEVLSLLLEAANFLSDDYDTGKSYKPADNYDDLLKQFNALINLNRSLSQQVSFYRRNIANEKANVQEIAQLHEQINSERETNASLTDEVSRLGDQLLERDKRIAAYEVHKMAHDHSSQAFPSQHDEAVRRADEAEILLEKERQANAALIKENKRLSLVEHLTKSTARALGIQKVNDPFVAQDVLSHTSSLIWNFEQLTRELKLDKKITGELLSSRLLSLPEKPVSQESVAMVSLIASKMLLDLSEGENKYTGDQDGRSFASNWEESCIMNIHQNISENNHISAINCIAFALYHHWCMTTPPAKD